jgi:hypothetical protein
MPGYARIVDTAMLLRAQAPDSWEQFVVAMREYAAASTSEMLRCPPEMLQRAQGMALTANDISAILQNAPKLKDKIIHERSNPTGNQAGY